MTRTLPLTFDMSQVEGPLSTCRSETVNVGSSVGSQSGRTSGRTVGAHNRGAPYELRTQLRTVDRLRRLSVGELAMGRPCRTGRHRRADGPGPHGGPGRGPARLQHRGVLPGPDADRVRRP